MLLSMTLYFFVLIGKFGSIFLHLMSPHILTKIETYRNIYSYQTHRDIFNVCLGS